MAVATGCVPDALLFIQPVLLPMPAKQLGEFNPKGFHNMAWAFAPAQQANSLLFEALGMMTGRHVGNINAQDIAVTAWVFASAAQSNAALFVALAQ
eukprot:gnl/MRDRNA2_/MRDRNA2_401075_c0_seq1.p1 gnl/MRDRNA2_/MRDRNA2_401075_c0~~gnl/MRDRNA2_/MRDRNA2_401075_c0_seq1.p1  ORF type:complete len:111 (-),score=18.85 gnl/MRDRNA2_/MRDRNA2_401075_c0_seq1:38-325(-)